MRNDAILNSGMNSRSSLKVAEKRKEQEQKAEKEKNTLKAKNSELYELLDTERERFSGIESIALLPTDTDTSILQEIKARQQHLEFLKTFEIKLAQIVGGRNG